MTASSPESPRLAGGSGITHFAPRGGHRLTYETHGDPGAAVLGLHDLLADRGQLRSLLAGSVTPELRLLLPDARGHGASPAISGRTYAQTELIADALAVLDAEATDTADIVAIGWGVAVALGLALAAPHRVSSLVLVEPYLPSLLTDHSDSEVRAAALEHTQAMQSAANAGEKGQIDRALDLVLGVRVGPDWRERMPKARQGAARRSAGNLAALLTGFLADPMTPEKVRGIPMPVIVLLEPDSMPVVRGTGESLAAGMPQARIERDGFTVDHLLAVLSKTSG